MSTELIKAEQFLAENIVHFLSIFLGITENISLQQVVFPV
jgi:hypothetical protein